MSGRVYLVGAGPGDPGLLSARALESIAAAEVILYDRLIPAAALDGARTDAELLFVGKEGGGESVPQEQTERLMIERAREGRTVVRLKGGDPFVFGRGGEEALALREAGIAYEVVPGVTAGVAAAAYAGIPVTHRGLASAVALVTGHEDPDKDLDTALDWAALAGFPGTLVFYMGVRRLPGIASSLITAGRSPREPVAIVERGTLPGQRTVTGTLSSIADVAAAAGVRAPSITVVGPVAALADELSWLAPQPPDPLSGLTVAVTRARASASGLARQLSALGARVIQAPIIRTVPLPGAAPDLGGYDLLCLTSPVGVEMLFERLRAAGGDARALAGVRVAAIGPGTAEALDAHGIAADIVPERSVAEGLVQALADVRPPVRRALIARAREGREVLPDALREQGAEVEVLALYETVAEPLSSGAREAACRADYITFTSASTVRFFFEALGGEGGGSDDGDDDGAGRGLSASTRIVSIGPITSEALREHGLEPHVEASGHDIDGLLGALLADAAGRSGSGAAKAAKG
jgi:uroporphyrinogen III methyltransferase / synthase